jgi:RNA-directed DNA polymerase
MKVTKVGTKESRIPCCGKGCPQRDNAEHEGYIWKRWKKIRTRYTMLKKLGLDHNNALKFACTRKGYWRIANSQILKVTVTNARLRRAGYTFFSDYFKTVMV